ncbi:MAG: ribosome silencing factor [Actinomycetota bacterium]
MCFDDERDRSVALNEIVPDVDGEADTSPTEPAPGAELVLDLADLDPVAQAAVAAIDDKLGTDPVVLRVAEVLAIAELFVVGSGSNARQVRAIVEEVERLVRERTGESPIRTEGQTDWRWVVLDYGDTVVHVFDDEVRAVYDLERLWADVPAWRDDAD